MKNGEARFMRSFDPSWKQHKNGMHNKCSDQQVLEALKTCRTHTEAEYKLGVCHSSLYKYMKQLREKGLLDEKFKPIK